MKEVNEKTRMLAFKLLIKLGYTVQRCQDNKADGTVTNVHTLTSFILYGGTSNKGHSEMCGRSPIAESIFISTKIVLYLTCR